MFLERLYRAARPSEFTGGQPQIYAEALATILDTFTADGLLPAGAADRRLTNLRLVGAGPFIPPVDLGPTYDGSVLDCAAQAIA